MHTDEWERTRKALETELIEKAFDLADHMGRVQGFSLQVAHTSPALYLRFGEIDTDSTAPDEAGLADQLVV